MKTDKQLERIIDKCLDEYQEYQKINLLFMQVALEEFPGKLKISTNRTCNSFNCISNFMVHCKEEAA